MRDAYARAQGILREHLPLLHKVASALLEFETLDRHDVDRILAEADQTRQPRPRIASAHE